jgi:hypothetical protein
LAMQHEFLTMTRPVRRWPSAQRRASSTLGSPFRARK